MDIGGRPPLWDLWRSCFRLAPGPVFVLGAWVLVGGVAQIVLVLPTARIIQLIVSRPAGVGLSWHQLLPPVGLMCVLIALAGLARLGVHAYAWRLGRRFNGFLRAQVMVAVSGPPGLDQLEDPAARARLNTAVGVGPSRYNPGGAIVRTSQRAMFIVQMLTAVVVLCVNNLWAGLVVAATMLACQRMFARSVAAYAVELIAHAGEFRRVDYLRSLLWKPSSARELRVFDMWPWLRHQVEDAWQAVQARLSAHRRSAGWAVALSAAIFTVGFGTAFVMTFMSWSAEVMSLPAAVVSLQVMVVLAVALCRTVVDADQSVELGVRALPAAAELVRSVGPRPQSGSADNHASTPVDLSCTDLSFTYSWGERSTALRDVTVHIEPGEHVGIVGPNGAGKSTFLKLVCGFYRPEAGQFQIDGVDLSELDRSAWQRGIAAVHQDFVRYPRTLLFNVAPRR